MCILLTTFDPFRRVYISIRPFSFLLFIFTLDRCPRNLVLSYLHPFAAPLIELIPPFSPSPFYRFIYLCPKKLTKHLGSVVTFGFGVFQSYTYTFLCRWEPY
jgi:hypothetical protein